jgi:cytochrome b561
MTAKVSPATAAATRIAAGDDRTRYDALAMTLHWLTAVLVLTQFGLGELWDLAPRSAKHLMIVAHLSFGILLAAVLIVRIAWRLTPGHRVRDAATGLVELASKVVHYVLYGLLAAGVVLGFLWRWSGGEALSFFGLLIPPPFAAFSKPANHFVGDLHDWVAWTIIVLAVGHAGAALFHHFVLRDDVLRRMLPGGRAR